MQAQSRVIRKLNLRQARIIVAIFVLILALFSAIWIPSTLKLSAVSIDNRLELICEDYANLEAELQQLVYTFSHDTEITTLCASGQAASVSESAAARITLHAQAMKSSARNILNFCMDDLNGRLISSLNYSGVDRRAILDRLEGYQRVRESKGTYLSPLMTGDFSASDGSDQPYFVYAQSVNIGDNPYVIVVFYDATYFLRRQAKQMNGLIDGYSVYGRNDEELLVLGDMGSAARELVNAVSGKEMLRLRGRYKVLDVNGINLRVVCYSRYITVARNQMLVALLALALVTVLAVVNVRSFARVSDAVLNPLMQLSREMQAYEPGKTVGLDIQTDDEIGDLCADFRRMAAKVGQQVDEIRDKERRNAVTQYRLLATQIDPHFIYNTMSLINALAYNGDIEGVMKVNTALIRLLRERLNTRATILDSVRSEIETLNEYLKIMGYRYNDAVQVGIDVDPQLYDCQIPKNLLQPLIENSFLHGLADEDGVCRGSIDILIYEEGEHIVIEVSDDGKGMSAEKLSELNSGEAAMPDDKHTRIGFDNLRQRLGYIYGQDFELTVYSVEGKGSTVTIVLPKEAPQL